MNRYPGNQWHPIWVATGQSLWPQYHIVPMVVAPDRTVWLPIYYFPFQLTPYVLQWQPYYVALIPSMPHTGGTIFAAPRPHLGRVDIRRLEALAENL